MQFPTVAFAVFFLAAFTANWLLRPHHLMWRATMVVLSLYFCAWVDIRFVAVVVGAALANGALAWGTYRAMPLGTPTAASRRLVRTAVGVDVALLAVLGYHGFLVDAVAATFDGLGLSLSPAIDLLVPVGLSFYVLQAISYVVDVGRGEVQPVAFADLLLYLCFFPHLVAGPLVRVDELVPQFHERPDPRRVPATDAFVLVGVGLLKIVVVASYLGREVVDPAFAAPEAVSGPGLLVVAWAFAVQIYAGFSGAADIAIGCGLLLGIHYPLAFDAPYRARSLQEFWDRWNLTVGRWMHDYVFVPLGADHLGPGVAARNVMVTAVLGGLWYGAGWTFVVWGLLHGALVLGERTLGASFGGERADVAEGPLEVVTDGLRWLVTFNLVSLAWIFYRAESVGDGLGILGRIVSLAGGDAGAVTPVALVIVAATLAGQFLSDRPTLGLRARFSSWEPLPQALVLAAVLTAVGALGPDGALPYAYFPF